MRRIALALALVGCGARPALDAPVTAPRCVVPSSVGTTVVSCNGLRFDVTVPAGCVKGGCGLVVDIPGLSMTGRMEDASTHMRALGEAHGYVIVQPTANAAPKDRGLELQNPRWPVWNYGDDARVFGFLEQAIDELAVDRTRVHATGFSMGGMMTWRLLCKHADVFASIAPAAGTAGCAFAGDERPSREVPILFMHGRRDRLVPFYAGKERRDAVVLAWKMRETERVELDAHATRTRFTSERGTVFEFIEHDYTSTMKVELGGHCFPGSDDPGTEPDQLASFRCEGPNAFVWGERVMDFFRAHPRVP